MRNLLSERENWTRVLNEHPAAHCSAAPEGKDMFSSGTSRQLTWWWKISHWPRRQKRMLHCWHDSASNGQPTAQVPQCHPNNSVRTSDRVACHWYHSWSRGETFKDVLSHHRTLFGVIQYHEFKTSDSTHESHAASYYHGAIPWRKWTASNVCINSINER